MNLLKMLGIFFISTTVFACAGDTDEKKKDVVAECQGNADCMSGKCNLLTSKCVENPNNGMTTNNGTTNPNNGTTDPNNGTTGSNNGTTGPICGDGTVEGNEICDGNCPAQCDDMDVCTADALQGSAGTCDAVCMNTPITACVDGDGCCAPGCTAANDLDCDMCGNGVVDANETCDKGIAAGMAGACPTQCNDNDACTNDALVGNADQCSAMCSNVGNTSCVSGDGCCPANCTTANDSDCQLNGTIFGAACTNDAECGASNVCLTEMNSGNPGGYCTLGCQSDNDCGNNAFCSGGICLPSCTTNANCRAGYSCSDFYGTGNTCNRDTALAEPGGSCMDDANCQSSIFGAVCFTEVSNPNFADGFCTLNCLGDDDSCQAGSTCTGIGPDAQGADRFICSDKCVADADCRTGYLCTDFDSDGQTECWPGATGMGLPGSACTAVQDCAGGDVGLCASGADFVDGYCTTDCTQTGCAAGSECTALSPTASFCLDSCDVNVANDCRSGYSCVDMDNNNTTECFPIATGSAGIGSSCTAVQDCAGGQDGFCLTNGFMDGYCSIDCTNDPNVCGADNCIPNNGTSLCLDDCTVDADCRAGYICGAVSMGGATSCLPN